MREVRSRGAARCARRRGPFADVRPAASLLEASRLADPEMLVEIEAVAVVD